MASPLTTHVLDLRLGKPAAGVGVRLERMDASGGWHELASGSDQRRRPGSRLAGRGRAYQRRASADVRHGRVFRRASSVEHFYPQVTVEFAVADASRHHHVPLLLSPFGYSTYRGS